MKVLRSKKGFTLVELLLYLGIFSILLTVTLQMFGSVFEFQLESQAVSSVDVDGKFVINRFNYDVSKASSITLPATLGATGSALTIVVNSQSLTYSLSNGDINLNNASTGTIDQLNSTETTASNLSFTRLEGSAGKDLIQMSFTLTSEVTQRKGKEVRSFQTTGGLR